jgi:hypothetical protein
MPTTVPFTRRGGAAIFAALTSLAVFLGPLERALADKPSTPVTVVNPQVPVTVDNPATMPAFTSSVDDPGRIAYQSKVRPTLTDCGGGSECTFNFSKVPNGKRLVIQHVSGVLQFDGTPSVSIFLVNNDHTASSTFFAPSVNKLSVFDQQVLVFFDAGATPSVLAAADGANFLPAVVTQVMTLTGYMLDCNASPCAPIAP